MGYKKISGDDKIVAMNADMAKFGMLVKSARTRVGLTTTELSIRITSSSGFPIANFDIERLESADTSLKLNEKQALAIVQAITSHASSSQLSGLDRKELYNAINKVFNKKPAKGPHLDIRSTTIPQSRVAEVTNFQRYGQDFENQRKILREFFKDADGEPIQYKDIAKRLGIGAATVSGIMGEGNADPSRSGALSEANKEKYIAFLRDIGKSDKDIASFEEAFDKMREIVGWQGKFAPEYNHVKKHVKVDGAVATGEPDKVTSYNLFADTKFIEQRTKIRKFFLNADGTTMDMASSGVDMKAIFAIMGVGKESPLDGDRLSDATKTKLAEFLRNKNIDAAKINEFEQAFDKMRQVVGWTGITGRQRSGDSGQSTTR